MSSSRSLALAALVVLLLVPAAAYGQASIAGVVRDTSGAVLPGVTVEVESPALIERVRLAVTDGNGRYRVEELRPGAYSVSFTLPGFAVVRREGIQLTGSFVATVNADLRVGGLEETITVTGEAPIVDVQSIARQRVVDDEVLNVLPTGRVAGLVAAAMPNITQNELDVGGISGEANSGSMVTRGVADTQVTIGNVTMKTAGGSSGPLTIASNLGAYQEVAIDTGGLGVERMEGGARINLIPREGGNTFHGFFYGDYANSSLQSSNLTESLKDSGLTANAIRSFWDVNPGLGGPIVRDKLWFHWTMRAAETSQFVPVFFNKNAGDPTKWTYEPDTSREFYNNFETRNWSNVRLTWQASQTNKFGFTYDDTGYCECPGNASPARSPEATQFIYSDPRSRWVAQWTAPLTNRLLLQATTNKFWTLNDRARRESSTFFGPSAVPLIPVQDQALGMRYRGLPTGRANRNNSLRGNIAASYITGTHAIKVGWDWGWNEQTDPNFAVDAPMEYRFRNGVPNRITLFAVPYDNVSRTVEQSLFVQDRWTRDRMTLTFGLRYAHFGSWYPEVHVGPGQFAPTRNITLPRTDGVSWDNITSTAGLAYDLLGDGKTALNVSLGKYLPETAIRAPVISGLRSAERLANRTNRSWRDANGDYVPDCDLLNPARNGECGAMSNPNFGGTQPVRDIDPDLATGWNKSARPDYWQFTVGVQREILPRVSVEAAYWRTWYGNFVVTDDRAVGPDDFDEFSIRAPLDSRLPGGGGYVISGLYDIKPEKFGLPASEILTSASKFGKQTEIWNGVDLTMNARPGAGFLLQGGLTTQRRSTNNCEVVASLDNPSPLFCDAPGTFFTQAKFLASYLIPRIDLQVSGNVQSLAGPEILAEYTASLSEITPSLGRPLAGGERNIDVQLIEPRTMYGDRVNMLDLRLGKILRFGQMRATVSLDVYNVFNANPVLEYNEAFDSWQEPLLILTARYAKIGFKFDF